MLNSLMQSFSTSFKAKRLVIDYVIKGIIYVQSTEDMVGDVHPMSPLPLFLSTAIMDSKFLSSPTTFS